MGITSLFFAGGALIGLLLIGFILTRLYKRATKEVVFIRTGFGGEKVIMDGGALVFPILHEVQSINMTTVKLIVNKKNEQALITKDRLRADISAEFYLRVKATKEAVSMAAQTLGSKTLNPKGLLELMEGKLVDVLRSTAAGMDMNELHEQRVEFIQKVQKAVTEDLVKNGLELEAISLTGLDQTAIEYFNIQNVFDAEGIKKITEQTELRKKEKNDIEQNTRVSIENKNLEAEKAVFKINKEKEEARIEQETSIKNLEAERNADVLKIQEDSRKRAKIAEIEANALIQETEINKNKEVESKKILTDKEIAITSQDKEIAISLKAQEELEAKTKENLARAKEIKSQEEILTAKELEIAKREKELALVEANKQKEATIIEAQGKSEAILSIAEAKAKDYEIDAAGKKALVEAENAISIDILKYRVQEELVKVLPNIVEQLVKPMENIDSIKIIDAKGLIGSGSIDGNSNGTLTGGKGFANDILDASLKHKAYAPMLNSLMSDLDMNVNLNADNMTDLVESFVGKDDTKLNDKEAMFNSHIEEKIAPKSLKKNNY